MKRIFFSLPVLFLYLFLIGMFIFAPGFTNYFVADDFTWLRWAADCQAAGVYGQCLSSFDTIRSYFTDAQNFFYRPGTKSYFYIMFPFFELFPSTYHFVSYLLHFIASSLVFLILHKFLGKKLLAFIGALLFLVLSVHAEAILWISVTGHLVSFVMMLCALLLFMYWREIRHVLLFIPILISLFTATLFYEAAVIAPILLIGYDLIMSDKLNREALRKKWYYGVFLLFIPLYYAMRTLANSFVSGGDYNYSLVDIPFNVVGNLFGYLAITVLGTDFLPIYQSIRSAATQQIPLTLIALLVVFVVFVALVLKLRNRMTRQDRQALLFSLLLFITPLLPFLALGNIAPRYVYLSSVGIILIVVYLMHKLVQAAGKKNYIAAVVIISVVTAIYAIFNVSILYRINSDWQKAGEITNDLLTNLNVTYAEPGALPSNPVFYFVSPPLKYGDAWVFPWGLPDALWFAFRETPVSVKQTNDLEEALTAKDHSRSVRVFEFLPDGSVVSVNRNQNLKKK
jgi:hypothetical protein